MSLESLIFQSGNFLNVIDISAKDMATIGILDQSEGFKKPYIKCINEKNILKIYNNCKFPVIKWCGYPKENFYNFSVLASNLYQRGLLRESAYFYIKNLECVECHEKIEWGGKVYIDNHPKKQSDRFWEINSRFDIKCLIITKRALYKLYDVEYNCILEALKEAGTILYVLKKDIDSLWKYPKKFYIPIETQSIMYSQIDGMLLMESMREKYLRKDK